jgi:hypothetical protein
LEAIALLASRSELPAVEIVGAGPLEESLRARSKALGLDPTVTFHGYIEDHGAVERILAGCSVAVAPYKRSPTSFTRYADPGKLKAYLAAGLPTVLTDVPPNAHELAAEAGAEVVDDEPAALAAGIARALASPSEWAARRAAAIGYAQRFDWNALLGDLLRALGPTPEDADRSSRGHPANETGEVRGLGGDDRKRLEDADRERPEPHAGTDPAADERRAGQEHEREPARPNPVADGEEGDAHDDSGGRRE